MRPALPFLLAAGAVALLAATNDTTAPSSAWLALLPDGEEKRRFVLDCTGCHQFDARIATVDGRPRTAAEWEDAVARMLRYGGATGNFPVISSAREPRATAEWLVASLGDRVPDRGTTPVESGRWRVTEFMMPVAQDLPHDVAVAGDGRVVITGMFTHVLYVLDPATGHMDTVPIPVPRANPRALEIAPDGSWWVAMGGPRAIARHEPATGRWRVFDAGVYPHSVAVDSGGHGWFNGHFTRQPEIVGRFAPDSTVRRWHVTPHPTLAADPGGPTPYEIRIGPDGRLWGSELHGNRLFALDPGSGHIDTFSMPRPHMGPRRFDVDARGIVWIPAYAANALVRLDPRTRQMTTIPLPVADGVPYVARVDHRGGRVWVGTGAADALLGYDPATRRWEIVPLPSRGAMVRHMAVDARSGDVWLAYGASPGIPARVARVRDSAGSSAR